MENSNYNVDTKKFLLGTVIMMCVLFSLLVFGVKNKRAYETCSKEAAFERLKGANVVVMCFNEGQFGEKLRDCYVKKSKVLK